LSSQHCKGEAIDIDAGSNAENKKIHDWIKNNLEFDQLIWEYGNSAGPDWVHVSFTDKKKNRKQLVVIK
jgi:zinc D-Ala-D-Ala carboxypeptidase